ncbi:hypothetical protein PUND_a0712 [Pseudoalteromonas undina]|uniref:Uncharacterized protein n=1 Tax=Pseudoalteromonas undina TaxID=43660 RepID=A0ABN0NMV0_9GAMM|nr:hypothetical protein [Pseudoalteromonas undina]KAF7769568.1 hypothetical protein PUND_a0712 [Pseudoalteromonas undina]KPH90215.1 hypothetical protein AMS57_12050 [Pseudoalteromonas undina]
MKSLISILVMVFALTATNAFAVPHKDKHANKHANKHHWKKQKYNQYNNKKWLSKKQAKQLIRQGWTPPGWHRSYHQGDILGHDIYKRARVIDRERDTVRVEVDRTIIHLVHDTREILSILQRY